MNKALNTMQEACSQAGCVCTMDGPALFIEATDGMIIALPSRSPHEAWFVEIATGTDGQIESIAVRESQMGGGATVRGSVQLPLAGIGGSHA